MDFQVFHQRGKRSDYKICGNSFAKPCIVMFSNSKNGNEEVNECCGTILVESGGNTRGMHWKSWDKLCSSKDDGGLGFKDLTDFNTAMFGKQFWRLIDKPNTLFSCVFKGMYFRNASPLEPIRSYSSSYGWRSIVSARSLVSKRLIKRVGSGSFISV